MSNLSKSIEFTIKQVRLNAGLTQADCVAKIGLSQAQLNHYEPGTDNLSHTQVERLFDALGMDVEVIGKLQS